MKRLLTTGLNTIIYIRMNMSLLDTIIITTMNMITATTIPATL